jgi:broad-specificity NMP kinase
MLDLSFLDKDEIRARLEWLLTRVDELYKEISPKAKELVVLRQEAGEIYQELKRRGLVKDEVQKGDE